jgi:hypothetical protein
VAQVKNFLLLDVQIFVLEPMISRRNLRRYDVVACSVSVSGRHYKTYTTVVYGSESKNFLCDSSIDRVSAGTKMSVGWQGLSETGKKMKLREVAVDHSAKREGARKVAITCCSGFHDTVYI